MQQGVVLETEKNILSAGMEKSPSVFAFTRYRNLVYLVSRDTRAAGDLFCRM